MCVVSGIQYISVNKFRIVAFIKSLECGNSGEIYKNSKNMKYPKKIKQNSKLSVKVENDKNKRYRWHP